MNEYEIDHGVKRSRMQKGPRILDDGITLIVPSEYYDVNAKNFWRSRGFRWSGADLIWIRNISLPLFGQVYDPAAWLASTRRKFYEFWPEFAAMR